MGHRTFVMLSCVAMTFASQLASALGLGDITLRSSLNQPLTAEIKLLQVGDLSETDILVGLASQEDFERVGVDRPFFLTDLRYEVRLDTPRGDLILVTSRKAVREPYLNFIVQVRWPSGKLLREYTILMDLPVFSDQAPGSVAPAQTDFSDGVAESESLASDDFGPRSNFSGQSSRSDFASESFSSGDGTYGPVRANDTLWEIAASARPDQGSSIQQTMIAIQALNPDAFINNNINLLKRGQVLRLPDRDQVRDISLRQANAEVAQQNSEWTSAGTLDSAAQLDARNFTSDEVANVSEPEGRVKLSSPDDAFDSNEGRGSGAGDSSTEALENELATTLEQLDKSSKENTELRSKIESLEEQISTMERMVEVSNEELRALELSIQKTKEENAVLAAANASLKEDSLAAGDQLAEAEEEAAQELLADELDSNPAAIDEADSVSESAPELDESALADSVANDLANNTQNDAAEQQGVVAPTERPATVVSRPAEKGLLDTLMDNIIYILGGFLALAVAAYFFISKRRDSDEELTEDELADLPAFDDQPLISEASTEEVVSEADDVTEDLAELILPDEPVEEEVITETESQTGDVVGEADIYIAYGKYEQAAEMLNKGLAAEPDNADIHLKLLEVFANQEDVAAFDSQFTKLLALGDEEATERGHQLRATISGASEFMAGDTASLEDSYQSDDLQIPQDDENETVFRDRARENEELSLLGSELDSDDPFADLNLDAESTNNLDSDLDLELGVDSEEASDLEHELDLGLSLDSSDSSELDNSLDLDLGIDSEASDKDDMGLGDDLTEGLDFDLGGDTSLADDLDKELDLEFGLAPESSEGDELAARDDLDLLGDGVANGEDSSGFDFDMNAGEDLDKDFDNDFAALDADLEASNETSDESLSSATDSESEEELNTALSSNASSEKDLDFDISNLDDLDAEMSASSEDIDEFLDLSFPDEEAEAAPSAANGALDDLELGDEELDLSSLESELQELTSDLNVGDDDLSSLELGGESGGTEESNGKSANGLDDLDLGSDLDPVPVAGDKVDTSEMDALANGDDSMFNQALTGVPDANLDFEIPEVDPESLDDDGELDFLNDSDETATKLDLARAYIDMGDEEGAKDILAEIRAEGSEAQRLEADRLSQRLS